MNFKTKRLALILIVAAIYTLSKQPKSEIASNYLHDFSRHDWFEVDMKEESDFSRIAFLGSVGDNPDYPSDCDILASTDGKEWKTVAEIRDNNNLLIDTEFETVSARYIKIVITKARSAWWDIRTIKVYK